jgi:hypothetical protein
MGLNALICPDRSLTLGLPNHSDVILSTILLQGEILPIAFVINIAHMLQVRTYIPICFSLFSFLFVKDNELQPTLEQVGTL